MNILQKAKLESLAFKIGGGILGTIGLAVMSRGFIRDGIIDGTRDTIISNKVREIEGTVDAPLEDYFYKNINI